MPYKHNQNRRHKFDKASYKVRNWPEYDQALKNRGSLTVWFTEEAIKAWQPDNISKKQGGQQTYSDIAIKTGLILRSVYKQIWTKANRRFSRIHLRSDGIGVIDPTTQHYLDAQST